MQSEMTSGVDFEWMTFCSLTSDQTSVSVSLQCGDYVGPT